MRYGFTLALWCLVGIPTIPSTSPSTREIAVSKIPLTPEQNQIYAGFLDSFLSSAKEVRNLSDKTFPLAIRSADERGPCLGGVQRDESSGAGQTVHLLAEEIARGRSLKMVDENKIKLKDPEEGMKNGESVESAVREGFDSGVLSLSEIVFDKTHRYAIFQFRYVCGPLCGRGGTIVFEKVGEQWKDSKRRCSLWVS